MNGGASLPGEDGRVETADRAMTLSCGPPATMSFRLAIGLYWHEHTCRREESPMSSLMVDFIISLDGYGAAEGWPGLWGMEGPEYLAWLEEDGENRAHPLMGATTYRLMSVTPPRCPTIPASPH